MDALTGARLLREVRPVQDFPGAVPASALGGARSANGFSVARPAVATWAEINPRARRAARRERRRT